ncbi:DUF308 domain-containing protein [Kitasatospora sp. NPDC004669]|uniref:DUF308 domain-containing protein n=1 Tax=Kitasatospora sp. NPDC004669 TaxID=3154555 RepID=UPI0033A1D6E0
MRPTCQDPLVKHVTYRLHPAQIRRQWIFSTLYLAGGAYLLYRGSLFPMNVRTAAVMAFGVLLIIGGLLQVRGAFSSVSFDEREIWWTGALGSRKRFAWADITNVEVGKNRNRPDSGDVVRATHREHGDFKLPAVIGMPGAWRDPDFETKAADVIATWRAATATSEPAA